MGPIFIILGPMGGIHIPADGLPRDYELLRGNGASDASRRHRHSLLGIIFVILYNNIIFGCLCGCIMVYNLQERGLNLGRPKQKDDGTIQIVVYTPSGRDISGIIKVNVRADMAKFVSTAELLDDVL